MLLSNMLKNENPAHRIEQVMLITDYACGCVSTITYGGQPAPPFNTDKREKAFKSNSLWSSSSDCSKGHGDVDFSEIEDTNIGDKIALVTSIKCGRTDFKSCDN